MSAPRKPTAADPRLRADFADVTPSGYIRPPWPVQFTAWRKRMDERAMAGALCTHDGHGGFQITPAGRAALDAAEREGR